ncbi:MAG: hypothetical protein U5R31_13475 [Acidimicrobiia bacterium]|nr:hypothetical protein [Acidimicrobiia bacterium]
MVSGVPGAPDDHRRSLRLGPVDPAPTSSTQERLRRECAELREPPPAIRFLFSGTIMKHWWLFFVAFGAVLLAASLAGLPYWAATALGGGVGALVMVGAWKRRIVAVTDSEVLVFDSGSWRLAPRRLVDRLPLVALTRTSGPLGWRVRLHGEELSIGRGAEEAQVAAAIAAVDAAIHRHDAA